MDPQAKKSRLEEPDSSSTTSNGYSSFGTRHSFRFDLEDVSTLSSEMIDKNAYHVEVGGVPWGVVATRNLENETEELQFLLNCTYDYKTSWSVDAIYAIVLIHPNGEQNRLISVKHTFGDSSRRTVIAFNWDKTVIGKGFIEDDSVTVEVRLTFTAMSGIRPLLIFQFADPKESRPDWIAQPIVVEGDKSYAIMQNHTGGKNIRDLPHDVLRPIISYLTIADRMSFWLSCGSEELRELIADTDAGYYVGGSIREAAIYSMDRMSTITIGHTRLFSTVPNLLFAKNQIFKKISFGNFYVHTTCNNGKFYELLEVIRDFKIDILHFKLVEPNCPQQITDSLRIMDNFPSSKVTVHIVTPVNTDELLSLVRVDELNIHEQSKMKIPTELLIKLLSSSKKMYYESTQDLDTMEWLTMMKIIAKDLCMKIVKLVVKSEVTLMSLHNFGFYPVMSVGMRFGKLLVLEAPETLASGDVILAYGKCQTFITFNVEAGTAEVRMQNGDTDDYTAPLV